MGHALGVLVLLLGSVAPAAAAEGGVINLDKSLIVQAVTFLLLLGILTKLLYRPLVSKMEERTQAIRKSLEEAQAARAEAQRERQELTDRIQAAHAEAQAIHARALQEAAEEQRRLVEAARGEATRLVEAARAETEQDIRRAREALRREVSELAIQAAEKLIRKSLRDEDHRRIVEDAIARVGKSD